MDEPATGHAAIVASVVVVVVEEVGVVRVVIRTVYGGLTFCLKDRGQKQPESDRPEHGHDQDPVEQMLSVVDLGHHDIDRFRLG